MQTIISTTRRNQQLGFNLIEASIVLGIVGLVLAGVFAAWSTVTSQQRVRKGADMAIVIVQQVRNAYGSRTSFSTTDTTAPDTDFTRALVMGGIVPSDYVTAANDSIKSPWGGDVRVKALDATNMTVSFYNVNKPDCKKLANAILGVGRTQGLTFIDGAAITTATTFSSIEAGVCTTNTAPLVLRFLLRSN